MEPAPGDDPFTCNECGLKDRLLIHRLPLRRLCASCVLRLNPHSFCPTCFHVYPPHPLQNDAVTCTRCSSISHAHCVASSSTAATYICPLCVPGAAPIVNLTSSGSARVLDASSARKLVAAAKIAFVSMKEAAAVEAEETERRAARLRAWTALRHARNLVAWKRRLEMELKNRYDSSSGDEDDDGDIDRDSLDDDDHYDDDDYEGYEENDGDDDNFEGDDDSDNDDEGNEENDGDDENDDDGSDDSDDDDDDNGSDDSDDGNDDCVPQMNPDEDKGVTGSSSV